MADEIEHLFNDTAKFSKKVDNRKTAPPMVE